MCLYCENKGKDFTSPIDLKQHMQSKGHCFMFTDCFEEYLPFYDFKVMKDLEFDE